MTQLLHSLFIGNLLGAFLVFFEFLIFFEFVWDKIIILVLPLDLTSLF